MIPRRTLSKACFVMESIGLQFVARCSALECEEAVFGFCLWLMATNKDTPKKFYSKRPSAERSSCGRLCKAVVDRRHSKDLFGCANRDILNNAQGLYGNVLRLDNLLPHLICRPCERRLDNATKFKTLIEETQKSLESEFRSKRLVDTSPSVAQPSKTKSQAARNESSRLQSWIRSLQFTNTSPSDVSHE